ncbi:hypothetical protein H257_08969 [Aphanomyces astaci]|uniref:Uncharacterized protein n=1 Tax=Aphanomyces astaci TaxID=112090 RepID=W4GCT0_APHAT|nr:hypothetical protein H257_08969 [Aphanomyces astaci]ETV77061.1 hypothetical protein H257_08969 [Aphanomyces astaci]|eukprot:XP_009833367.1 hypothetical protein H257_08969 [Aphanomyces astaci]
MNSNTHRCVSVVTDSIVPALVSRGNRIHQILRLLHRPSLGHINHPAAPSRVLLPLAVKIERILSHTCPLDDTVDINALELRVRRIIKSILSKRARSINSTRTTIPTIPSKFSIQSMLAD